jgi:hypothetical protein
MKKIILILLVAGLTVTTGCKKKEGCLSKLASNHCDDCDNDDGSCSYQAKFLFWWNQQLRDSCAFYGISAIKVFCDGQFQGSLPVSTQYWSSSPGCDAVGTLTVTKTWNQNASKNYSVYYVIVSAVLGDIYTSPTAIITLTGKDCRQEEITW